MMPVSIMIQNVFHAFFPTSLFPRKSPWGPSFLLMEKQPATQHEQVQGK